MLCLYLYSYISIVLFFFFFAYFSSTFFNKSLSVRTLSLYLSSYNCSLFEFTKHVSLLSINNHPLFPLPNHTSLYSSTHLYTWANMSLKETWYSGRTTHIDVLSSWVWIHFTMNVIIIAFILLFICRDFTSVKFSSLIWEVLGKKVFSTKLKL